MVNTYLIRSLKRVHDECERALQDDNYRVNQALAGRFSDILEDFKEEYPDNETIQDIEEVSGGPVGVNPRNMGAAIDTIQKIKLSTFKIADSLEWNTDGFKEISQSGEFTVINLSQTQTQQQVQAQMQRITVGQIIEDVENMMLSPDVEDELKELVREYEEELKDENTDPSRLRSIIDKANDYSDVAARKLIMLATERGVNLLAGMIS